MAAIIRNYQSGRAPQRITANPYEMQFFSSVNNKPIVWYFERSDGGYELFDMEGFYEGIPLRPVTPVVVERIRERAHTEAVQFQKHQIQERFGSSNYPDGIVLVGARGQSENDPLASSAARLLVASLISNMKSRGVIVGEVRSAVYQSEYFDRLMAGDASLLSDSGLLSKLRTAVMASMTAVCRDANSVAGISSCTIAMRLRFYKAPLGQSEIAEWSAIGAAANRSAAIRRAVDILLEEHMTEIHTVAK